MIKIIIEDNIVSTTWNSSNKKHLVSRGYEFTKLGDEINVLVRDILDTSPIKVEYVCDRCGGKFFRQRRHLKGNTYCASCSGKNRAKLCSCGEKIIRPNKYDKCFNCRTTQQTKNDYEIIGEDVVKVILRNSNNEINGYTFIDFKNLEKVIKYKWRIGTGNYIIGGKDNVTRLHRFIMNCPDDMEIDHINRITIDNREVNLKITNRKDNCNNRRVFDEYRYADLKYNDVANGDGITMSFWTQGCDLMCKGCHNFSIWDFNGGKPYTYKVIDEIKNNIYKDNIKRNFSILGGEPLHDKNINVTLDVLINVKRYFPNSKIMLWTGYLFENLNDFKHMVALQYIDVLIDGQFEEDKKDLTLKHKGSKNQREINVGESLKFDRIVLIN